jgi:transcriptional regulator
MYTPPSMVVTDETEVRAMVEAQGSGWFVTVADGAPMATLVPIVWDGNRVLAHVAKANPHWRSIEDGGPGLCIVGGPEAYVSPSWYPSKVEHGRVVPTWNYLAVHLAGPVRVHHDPDWLRNIVTLLTDRHERGRPDPWRVTDAPDEFVESMLRAIVGIELLVERVDAKVKASQNLSEADRHGVLAGLESTGLPGAQAVAAVMRRDLGSTDG